MTNWHGVWAIYRFEMARALRTLWQSLVTPVLTTSLYFIVFGGAIGSRMQSVEGVDYDVDRLTEVWRDPGTRLGLSVHFTSQFAPTVFALLWGYPFLVSGQGLSPTTASTLLTLMTFVALVAGPTIGRWTGRNPYYRSVVALGVVGAIALVWAVVLALPGRAPLWLLVVLVAVTAVGGPGSMIAFDLARTFHPDLFGDVDPAATRAEIESRFAPVSVPGTWWVVPRR